MITASLAGRRGFACALELPVMTGRTFAARHSASVLAIRHTASDATARAREDAPASQTGGGLESSLVSTMGASSLPPSRPAAATPEALSSGRSSGTGKALSNPSSVSLEERVAVWRSQLATQSRQLAESAEKQFSLLGLRINEVTGYKEVERLKLLVAEREKQMQTLREVVRSAKAAYDEAVSIRAVSQSSVNSLLERKHAWTDSDVSRFATLVRADHTSNLAVANSSAALAEAELAADKAFSELMQAILRRYHEEQVWSDKIRSVSTYANLVGLVINLVVFLGAVAVVEPWKRRKLVQKLEKRTGGMMERVEKEIGGLKGQIAVLVAAREGVSAQGSEPPLDLSIPAIEEATPEAQLPSGSSPRWSASFPNLLPSLDFIASPSHERDLAAVSACSLAAGIVLTQIARAVFG